MNLKKWQSDFYQGIFHPSEITVRQACNGINSSDSLSARQRLDIYRGSILGGMTSGLAGIYPVCEKLVGEHYFSQMVAGYLKQFPSDSPDLGQYGEHLAHYITLFEPAQDLIYLPHVAKLEWLWHQAFNALHTSSKQDEIQAISELDQLDEEQQAKILFHLTPSANLMKSHMPIHKIWQVNQDNFNGDKSVNLNEAGGNYLVWRNEKFNMHIDVLSDDEFYFLEAITQCKNFSQLAQLSCADKISQLLPNFLQMGLIIGFTLQGK